MMARTSRARPPSRAYLRAHARARSVCHAQAHVRLLRMSVDATSARVMSRNDGTVHADAVDTRTHTRTHTTTQARRCVQQCWRRKSFGSIIASGSCTSCVKSRSTASDTSFTLPLVMYLAIAAWISAAMLHASSARTGDSACGRVCRVRGVQGARAARTIRRGRRTPCRRGGSCLTSSRFPARQRCARSWR
jgi:hypothetical protein